MYNEKEIVKIYFTDKADIEFCRQYMKIMSKTLPDKIIIAIPSDMVTDVVFTNYTIKPTNEKVGEYPF